MSDSRRSATLCSSSVGLIVLAAACVTAACRPTAATPAATVSADTWAVVDGKEITRDDVDKAYRRVRDSSQTLSQEEALAGKLSLLNDLILQEILLAKAAALKLEVPQSELDTAYADARKNISDEAFQQELTRRGLTAADMREGTSARTARAEGDRSRGRREDRGHDQEVTDFFNANRAQFNIGGRVVSHRADRRHAGARSPDRQRDRRRCHDAAGGGGENPDADGAPQGRRVVPRSRDAAIPRILSRRRAAATWDSCRCRGSSRRRRSCATRC